MIPKEILKKIRRMQITTTKKATELFAGEYKSIFKGRGLEFEEVREYIHGDEIRSIDWNVTARMGRPFIKKYVEERELTLMLILDLSGSNYFGTVNLLKRSLAAEVSAVLAAVAAKNNDKVGLIVFTDRIEIFLPPRKGTKHVFRVIREALYAKPQGSGTDITACLKYLDRVVRKRVIAFLISDFYDDNIKKALAVANKRHDLVAVHISDPREEYMPDMGIAEFYDPETGTVVLADTSDGAFRRDFEERAAVKKSQREKLFQSVGVDSISISTGAAYENALAEFFKKRKSKRAR